MKLNPDVFLRAAEYMHSGTCIYGCCLAINDQHMGQEYRDFFNSLFQWHDENDLITKEIKKSWWNMRNLEAYPENRREARVLALLFCYWELIDQQKAKRKKARKK